MGILLSKMRDKTVRNDIESTVPNKKAFQDVVKGNLLDRGNIDLPVILKYELQS